MSEPTNQAEKPCLQDCKCKCGFYYGTHEDMGTTIQFDPESHAPGCPNGKPAEPPSLERDGVITHGVNCTCGYKVACEAAEEAENKIKARARALVEEVYPEPTPPPPVEPVSEPPIDWAKAEEWAREPIDDNPAIEWTTEVVENAARAYLALKAERDALAAKVERYEDLIVRHVEAAENLVDEGMVVACDALDTEDSAIRARRQSKEESRG